jgi:hypothetical protein
MKTLPVFRSVRIGEMEPSELLSRAETAGYVGDSARALLRKILFSPDRRVMGTVALTVTTLREMGITSRPDRRDIFERAFLHDWSMQNLYGQQIGLCPPEVAPALMVQFPQENFPVEVLFAMHHINVRIDHRGKQGILRMGRNHEDGRICLRTLWVPGKSYLEPMQPLVFALRQT